jgi:hypothetical protein
MNIMIFEVQAEVLKVVTAETAEFLSCLYQVICYRKLDTGTVSIY